MYGHFCSFPIVLYIQLFARRPGSKIMKLCSTKIKISSKVKLKILKTQNLKGLLKTVCPLYHLHKFSVIHSWRMIIEFT